MKQVGLKTEEIGMLCLTLTHFCHAGIAPGDGLALLVEEETAVNRKELLAQMARRADEGAGLAQIFRETGRFPDYVCGLLEVGEQVGRTEEALEALASHYESRARMAHRMKAALLYPAVLLVVLLAVLVILLVWVLPVFNTVYIQLGSRLTGVAGGLLMLGNALGKAMPVLCVVLGLVAAAAVVFAVRPSARERLTVYLRNWLGDKGLSRQIQTARFAQALSMGLRSGMLEQEAVTLAARLAEGNAPFRERCTACLTEMEQGASLASALKKTELLNQTDCRLLEVGMRTGGGEIVADRIAQRLLEESEEALETWAARVEPTVVIFLSVMVGLILMSVMLPLMHIMQAIG